LLQNKYKHIIEEEIFWFRKKFSDIKEINEVEERYENY